VFNFLFILGGKKRRRVKHILYIHTYVHTYIYIYIYILGQFSGFIGSEWIASKDKPEIILG